MGIKEDKEVSYCAAPPTPKAIPYPHIQVQIEGRVPFLVKGAERLQLAISYFVMAQPVKNKR
jgi:hypothetical protein